MYAYMQTFIHAYIHVNTQVYANPRTKLSPIHIRQSFPSQPPSPSPQPPDTAQGIACSSFLRPVLISKPRQTLGNVRFISRSATCLCPYLPILHFLVYPWNLAAPCCANKVVLGDFCPGTVHNAKAKGILCVPPSRRVLSPEFPPLGPQIMREDPATVKVLLEHGANRWEMRTEHFPARLNLMG